MSTILTQGAAAPVSDIARSSDWPFLGAAVAITALLVALVILDGEPRSAALIAAGFGLGVAFLKTEFSFTASWRRFLTRGEAGGLLAALLLIALAALFVVPMAAARQSYGGSIRPLGPSLVIGLFVCGIGMQLANGCGSGTLYTAGGGSGRMLIALLGFIIGSVVGAACSCRPLALGGIDRSSPATTSARGADSA